MSFPKLSPRRAAVLQFVYAYVQKNGYPPGLECIARGLGIASLKGVANDLRELERRGFVEWPRPSPAEATPDNPKGRLTGRQAAILKFLDRFHRMHGFPPTIREIADRFGIESPNGVMCHLRSLENKGYIHRSRFKSRSICVVAV